MNVKFPCAFVIASAIWPGVSWAVGFTGLGRTPDTNNSRATDVSETGSVAGTSDDTAFRWTLVGGLLGLKVQTKTPPMISGNGGVVAGGRAPPGGSERALWRWTSGGGAVDISPPDSYCSHASSLNYDGSALTAFADQSGDADHFHCKWTSGGGFAVINGLPEHIQFHNRTMIDLAGDAVIGASSLDPLLRGFLWRAGNPIIWIWLCDTPDVISDVGTGCSPAQMTQDAAVVVGATYVGNEAHIDPGHAFRWTEATGLEDLGELSGGSDASAANSLDGMGRRVVGWGSTTAGQEAMLWDSAHGMRRLVDILASYGVTVPPGWTLRQATRISPNGRFVVGFGDHAGHTEAWRIEMADLPTILQTARIFVLNLPAKTLTPAARSWLLTRLSLAYLAARRLSQVAPALQPWLQASLVSLLQQIDAKTENCATKAGFFGDCKAAATLDDYLQDALLWLPAGS